MIILVIFLFCLMTAIGVGILAGMSDFKGMQIPNMYPAMIAGAFCAAFAFLWLGGDAEIFSSLGSHIISGVAVFAVTYLLFFFGKFGGGDSKLLTAYAFWMGLKGLPAFLFFMSVGGALLGVAALILKRRTLFPRARETSWIGRVQKGENVVPYGIAIAFGAIVAFGFMGFFNPDIYLKILEN